MRTNAGRLPRAVRAGGFHGYLRRNDHCCQWPFCSAYALENISGNIANSQTTAFKRIETSFVDMIPATGQTGMCRVPLQDTPGNEHDPRADFPLALFLPTSPSRATAISWFSNPLGSVTALRTSRGQVSIRGGVIFLSMQIAIW